MQCKNCFYHLIDDEEKFYICPECFEHIEDNLPNDKNKKVELYRISRVIKDRVESKFNIISKFLYYLHAFYIILYTIMYNGKLKVIDDFWTDLTGYYLAILIIYCSSLGGIIVFDLIFSFVNIYVSNLYHKIKSNFLSLVINLSVNILIYSLFLFKFYGMFTSLVDEELLGKTFDNAPPNTDMNWHINFCNKSFFIYILLLFIAKCLDCLVRYYKYNEISKINEEFGD